MRLIMLGAPGAGKGTQAKNLSKKYNIPHISTGDIFRYNIKNKTELGKVAAQYIDKGGLVPDDITVKLIIDRIKDADCKKGYVLDGFPRTIQQAEMLDTFLEKEEMQIDYVILLSITSKMSEERIVSRRVCLKCCASYNMIYRRPRVDGVCDICGGSITQRDDDKIDTVMARLETYKKETAPLINYYEERNKIKKVLGQDVIDDTTKLVLEALGI